MLMPFGKHKGKPVADVPKRYLTWLIRNVDLQPPLLHHVGNRLYGTPIPETTATTDNDIDVIVGSWENDETKTPGDQTGCRCFIIFPNGDQPLQNRTFTYVYL